MAAGGKTTVQPRSLEQDGEGTAANIVDDESAGGIRKCSLC